jgi:hypothetical protein
MTCGGVGIGYFAKELHKKIRRARNSKLIGRREQAGLR